MSNKLEPGRLVVIYTREYGAKPTTIQSPVLDMYTVAIPIPARSSIATPPGQPSQIAGVALQSFYQVITTDDPDVRPLVCRPHWVDVQECRIVNLDGEQVGGRWGDGPLVFTLEKGS